LPSFDYYLRLIVIQCVALRQVVKELQRGGGHLCGLPWTSGFRARISSRFLAARLESRALPGRAAVDRVPLSAESNLAALDDRV